MATRWLDRNEMEAWRSYVETYADLMSAIERDLTEHGLSLGDYQVLVYLSEADGRSMRMCDLADMLQLSPSGLTRRLDGLVTAGFVTREPSTEDRRVMMGHLTDAGFDTLRAVAPHHVASVRAHIFDHLDDDQVAALASIFTAIGKGLAGVTDLPDGFRSYVAYIGIKDDSADLIVVAADHAVPTAAVFTQSRFAGPSVAISRANVADGMARAVVVVSKNANVANGEVGHHDAVELATSVAGRLGCEPTDVVITSTGVIGRRYPMDRVRAGVAALPAAFDGVDAVAVATGMMTTDTAAKVADATVVGSSARIVGVAKGVGMIEPDMATHISLLFTDAELADAELESVFRRVVDRTFNCVSIDTDTSTSDSSVIMASGVAGPVDADAFEAALFEVAVDLTKQIARDGEGANSLIEVHVDAAADVEQAKRVGKAIVNSPLVKTAVHGGDPNWGRVAMAIGKCSDDDIDQRDVVIRFGTTEVYPTPLDDADLAALSGYMRSTDVLIHVSLGIGDADATVWGCDLSDTYVRFNADYTT